MRRLDRHDHLDEVFDQMNKIFNQFQEFGKEFGREFGKELDLTGNVPVDIKEEDGMIIITADLPGVDKENINLKADEEGVEISAESSHEIQEENEKYLRRERSSRTFRRKIRWPTEVNPETVSAEYDEGVLTVEAEKEESEDWNVEIE